LSWTFSKNILLVLIFHKLIVKMSSNLHTWIVTEEDRGLYAAAKGYGASDLTLSSKIGTATFLSVKLQQCKYFILLLSIQLFLLSTVKMLSVILFDKHFSNVSTSPFFPKRSISWDDRRNSRKMCFAGINHAKIDKLFSTSLPPMLLNS
jgi:hypothetical protein